MPLSHIKGLIWDLDNTLYRFDQAFMHACHINAARTAQKMIPDLSYDDALDLALTSFAETGYSWKIFIDRYGIAYSDYHFLFHDTVDENLIEKNEAVGMALSQIDLPNVLITHSSRTWAEKILRHLSMEDYFPPQKIIALEDANFEMKHYSAAPFIKGLELLNLPPENVLVVEDTVKNLVRPKEMGMTTVLIHHGTNGHEQYDHVDFAYPDTLEFLGTLMLAKQAAA